MSSILVWIVLAVIGVIVLIWMAMVEADKEFMKCVCGKQPVYKKDFGTTYKKDPRGHRYYCECGITSIPGVSKHEAKMLWNEIVLFNKRMAGKR